MTCSAGAFRMPPVEIHKNQPDWLTRLISWLADIVSKWMLHEVRAAIEAKVAQTRELLIERPKQWLDEQIAEINGRASRLFPDAEARHARWATSASERLVVALSQSQTKAQTVGAQKTTELTFGALYAQVRPPTPEWLATNLAISADEHGWKRLFRVTAPQGKWSEDFDLLDNIPETITVASGATYQVDPKMVTVVYRRG